MVPANEMALGTWMIMEGEEVGLVHTAEDHDVHTVAHFLFLGRSLNDDNLSLKLELLWLSIK